MRDGKHPFSQSTKILFIFFNKGSCTHSAIIHIICHPEGLQSSHTMPPSSPKNCPCSTMLIIYVMCHFLLGITTSWSADLVHHWTVTTSHLQVQSWYMSCCLNALGDWRLNIECVIVGWFECTIYYILHGACVVQYMIGFAVLVPWVYSVTYWNELWVVSAKKQNNETHLCTFLYTVSIKFLNMIRRCSCASLIHTI